MFTHQAANHKFTGAQEHNGVTCLVSPKEPLSKGNENPVEIAFGQIHIERQIFHLAVARKAIKHKERYIRH